MIMNRSRIPEAAPLDQGSLNSNTPPFNPFLWMFHPLQDGMYPSSAGASFPNESRAENYMRFASQMAPSLHPDSNYFHIKYFFNLQAQLYTEPTDMEARVGPARNFVPYADERTGSDVMGYLNNRLKALRDPKCRRNPPSSQAERDVHGEAMDKGERREDLGTLETSWDIVWKLNQRRPSVIRRSISSDACSPPREAVLTTSLTSRPFDDGENETSTPPPSPSSTEYSPKSRNWSHGDLSSEEDELVEVVGTRASSPNIDENAIEPSVTNSNNAADSGNDEKWKFHCSFCKKRFQWLSHWQAHERIHTGERPFTCKQCGRSFTRADGLHCHVQTHFKKFYKCSTCSKTFTKRTCLERHVLDHTGVKPFTCAYCNKQFNKVEAIETHLMNHKGVKRFKCQYCNHAFINPKRLVRHIRGHTGK